MRAVLTLLAAGLLALPGCIESINVEPNATPDAEGAADWALAALVSEHDHTDPALHAHMTTPNFEVTGWDPLISEEYGTTVQGALCGDAQPTEDGRRLAAIQERGDVVFALADVTDAANPKWLGEFIMRTTYVYDLAVVPDGKHVVLVTSQTKTPEKTPAPRLDADAPTGDGLYWRSPCAEGGLDTWQSVAPKLPAEDLVPRPNSIILVNIEDPSAPFIADQQPLGGLGHGVQSVKVDDRTWVVASALSLHGPGQQFTFYEVADTPAGARLAPLSAYTAPVPEEATAMTRIGGHNDAWIAKHPVTGQTLAYLATNYEILILDLADPRMPKEIGRWTDYDPERPNDTGHFHSVHAIPVTWNDRHFIVVGPEFGGKPDLLPTGVVYVLETTDPSAPRLAGAWTLPHEVVWEGRLMWSTHYLTVHEKTAFVSMYHGGVWAIDLSGVLERDFTLLPSVGAFLPTNVSPAPPENPIRWAPTLEEVHAFEDGTLVTFDSNSGLYTFRFDASRPMTPPAPWTADLPVVG